LVEGEGREEISSISVNVTNQLPVGTLGSTGYQKHRKYLKTVSLSDWVLTQTFRLLKGFRYSPLSLYMYTGKDYEKFVYLGKSQNGLAIRGKGFAR
jgi:hypothetical protein